MIFKTFDSDLDKWTSKIGILGKTFDTIHTNITQRNSSDNGDLSQRFIVTSKDIEPQLTNIETYDTFNSDKATGILSHLQQIQTQVDNNTITWDDYYKSLKAKPDLQWQEEFVKTTNLQTASTQDVINAQKAARDAAIAHNNSLKQLTIGAKVSKAALNGLALAGNMLASFLVGLVIQKVVSYFYDLAHATEKAIEKANELTSAYNETAKSGKDNLTKLTSLTEEFSTLSKGVDENGKNAALTATEYERYKEILDEIVEIQPSLIKGYDAEGNYLVNNNTLLEDAIRLQEKYNNAKKGEYLATGSDVLEGARGEISEARKTLVKNHAGFQGGGGAGLIGYFYGDSSTNEDTVLLQELLKQFDINYSELYTGTESAMRRVVEVEDGLIGKLTEQFHLKEDQKILIQNQIDLIDIELGKIDAANQKMAVFLSEWATDDRNADWYGNIQSGYLDEFSLAAGQIGSAPLMSIEEMEAATKRLGEDFLQIQDRIPTAAIEDLKSAYREGTIDQGQFKTGILEQVNAIDAVASSFEESNPRLAEFLRLISTGYEDYLNQIQPVSMDAPGFSYSEDKRNAVSKYLSELKTLEDALKDLAGGSFVPEDFLNLTDSFPDLSDDTDGLANAIRRLMDESLKDLYDTLGKDVPTAVATSLDTITESAKNAGNSWDILNGQLDSIQNAYTSLINAQEEYSQNGSLSIDTLQALLSCDSEYLACLIDENGQLLLNGEAYQAMVAAKLADAEATAVSQAIAELDALTKVSQTQSTYDYVTANGLLAQSLAGLTGSYDAVMTSAAAAAQAQALSAAVEGAKNREADAAAIEKVMSSLNAKLQLIRSTSTGVTGSFKGMDQAVGGYRESAEQAKNAAEELTDALKAQKDELEKTKDKYDDVISAVNWFYDRQISSVETVIDGIERQNSQLEKQQDTYDGILSAVDSLYQREIDAAQSQIDAIQDKIDALKGANDEQERQITLEKAQYAWEQAKLQRTKYLYNGSEFVYDTDRQAISDAGSDLDNAKLDIEVSKLEKEQSALQLTIDELEKYRQKWADIADSYQLEQNNIAAAAYFGYNWESLILQNRLADITTFEFGYSQIRQSINDNQSLIDSYNEKITYYESLKSQWEAMTSKFEDEQNIQLLIETFGANYEQILLDGRTKSWDDFAAQYFNIQEQIAGLSTQIENAVNSAADAAENAVSRLQKSFADAAGLNFPSPPDTSKRYYGGGGKMLLETKHSGILSGPVGNKQPDTQKSFETIYEFATNDRLKYDEAIAKLKKGEIVLNENQQQSIAGNILDADRLIALTRSAAVPHSGLNSYTALPSYVTSSSKNMEVTQNINMNLPNIRTKDDAGQIAKELSRLYLSGVQYFNRH